MYPLHTASRAYVLCGFALLIFGAIPFVSRPIARARVSLSSTFDRQLATIVTDISTINSKLSDGVGFFSKLSTLESHNRDLYAQVIAGKQRISTLEGICEATGSAQIKPPSVRSTLISKFQGKWIVLTGSEAGVQGGELVIINGIYLGFIAEVSPSRSIVSTVQDTQTPLLVMHVQSRELGLLQLDRGKIVIQFSSKVDDIKADDDIVSVPDGKTSDVSYPLAKVEAVLTSPADSVSLVQVRPYVIPKVGSSVDIIVAKQ
jgi:cell shape-determining protein MreC